jgi:hypothetical protein
VSFAKGLTPLADGFWSITMYIVNGRCVQLEPVDDVLAEGDRAINPAACQII